MILLIQKFHLIHTICSFVKKKTYFFLITNLYFPGYLNVKKYLDLRILKVLDYKEFTALNSTFQSPFNKNEGKQLKELYNFVRKWDGKGKNLVLITHYSIITAVTNAVPSSGEIVVTNKNFKVLGTIQTD